MDMWMVSLKYNKTYLQKLKGGLLPFDSVLVWQKLKILQIKIINKILTVQWQGLN